MKQRLGIGFLTLAVLLGTALTSYSQSLDLVSTVDPAQGPAAGGGGDSFASVISPDGRFVLFASTANNLVLMTNNQPMPASIPANLNAYVRDRVSKTTTLISVDVTGTMGGDGDSLPVGVSTNGRYVLFESTASNLVPNDDNFATDVFVRDLLKGTTTLVSVNVDGFPADDSSDSSAMTPDGRYVVFVSAADDLVANDTNQIPDVFVRDLQTGTTVLASAGALSTNSISPIGGSDAPDITPDGRYVVFYSTATNLVPGVPPGGDVYVRDLVNQTTTWASIGARAAISNAFHSTTAVSYNQAISADGAFVAYEASYPSAGYGGLILRYNLTTGLTDLVHTNATAVNWAYESARSLALTPDGRFIAFIANTNNTSTTCVQLWDSTTGISTLVSGDSNNVVQPGSTCDWPLVDRTGRFIAFLSNATNLTANPLVGEYHIYRRDMQTGTTVLVDADSNGVGSPVSFSTLAQMSDDGGLLTFDCSDSHLVPNDRNRAYDVFARDLATDAGELISAHDSTLPCITPNGVSLLSTTSVSADGRFIAFASEADNLTPNDTNDVRDIFVRDLVTGKTQLVSVDTNGFSADGVSTDPAVSPDGRYVAFSSYADNLVPGDNNRAQDVFLRDLQLGVTTLVSVNTNGTGPGAGSTGGASYSPIVSSNGRYVLFRSTASNIAGGVSPGENLFLRDLQAGKTYALTKSGVSQLVPSMTPDGLFVLFGPSYFSSVNVLYLWDSQAANSIYSNSVAGTGAAFSSEVLSADASRIAFTLTSNTLAGSLQISDYRKGQTTIVASSPSDQWSRVRLSADGTRLACLKTARPLGTNQVYFYDLNAGTNALVSHAYNSTAPANGASDSVEISSDGRLIAYRSFASDVVPGDSNDLPDIIVYDTQTGLNSLLSRSRLGNFAADNRSLAPVFSGDGRTLCFVSWGSDIVPLDFNYSSDLFAYKFLAASLLVDQTPGQGPWIAWPSTQGKTYRVQFKDGSADPTWHDLSGTVTNIGNKGYLQDLSPAGKERFYRVTSF